VEANEWFVETNGRHGLTDERDHAFSSIPCGYVAEFSFHNETNDTIKRRAELSPILES